MSEWKSKGYSTGIPDECPEELEAEKLVPSYHMLAIAILSNDIRLRSLGMTVSTSVWYRELKRVEIEDRYAGKTNRQKRLF